MPTITDYIVAALLLYTFYKGFRKGFIRSVLGPIILIVVTIAAYIYYSLTKKVVITLIIGIAGPIILQLILCFFIKAFKKNKDDSSPILGKLGGGLFRAAWCGTWVFVILIFILIIPFKNATIQRIKADVSGSTLYGILNKGTKDYVTQSSQRIQTLIKTVRDPKKLKKYQNSPNFQDLMNSEKIQALIANEKITKQMENKDYGALLKNPQMREIFQDSELLEKIYALQNEIMNGK